MTSGADEGYWAETSAIYINHQHLRGLHKRELSWERSPRSQLLYLLAYCSNRLRRIKTSRTLWIDVAGTPLKLLINESVQDIQGRMYKIVRRGLKGIIARSNDLNNS